MAAFEYEALDPAGKRTKGVISADSPRLARRELRRKKLVPTKLTPARERGDEGGLAARLPSLGPALARFRAIGARDQALVTRQLATLINAAAPVEEALHTIALQSEKPVIRRTLMGVRASVTEGLRLSQALAQYPQSFSPLYRSMVAAGESSGTLGPVLERLADHMEKTEAMRGKVTTALVYPSFLALTAIGVVVALMTFVVPKVVEQFETLGRELPTLTVVMIGISDLLQAYGLIALLAGLVGLLLFARAMRVRAFRKRVDEAILGLPWIGRLVRQMHAARLARTMSALVSSGTPVLEGLNAARTTVGNTVLQDAAHEVMTQVREGSSLSNALRRTDAFPPLVVYMAAMGEKSGTLDRMLEKAADYMEAEFERVTAMALSLLEPAIIVVMGGVVAVIVLSILMPILTFNTLTI